MRHCLIIDDENQKEQIELLELKAKGQNFPITCHFLNLSDRELHVAESNGDTDDTILDFDKVYAKLCNDFDHEEIDIIACDYSYKAYKANGLALIQYLKKKMFKGRKMPYLLYSSKADEIKENLQRDVKKFIDDKEELKKYLESYFDTNPEEIIERTAYDTRIIEYLKRNKTPLNSKLESRLKSHGAREFRNIFPRFHGKTLNEIASLLAKSTEESDEFEAEFLDRSIAHFIYLEE